MALNNKSEGGRNVKIGISGDCGRRSKNNKSTNIISLIIRSLKSINDVDLTLFQT